jgi:hypothetical protein
MPEDILMPALQNPAQFALAGNAVFTLTSHATGARYTYKVRVAEDNATMHFVSVLTGPDNWANYSYLGLIRRGVYFHGGPKARIAATAPSAKAFHWFWRNLSKGADLTDYVDIDHMGKCGRCGKPLTVPASIQSGYGADCAAQMGLA